MPIAGILALIQAAGPLLSSVFSLAHSTADNLSQDDLVKLQTALAGLQAQNDADFARIDAKLQAAAQS